MERIHPPEPTSGTISDDLDRLEILVGRIGFNSQEQARTLLSIFDATYGRMQALEDQETRLRLDVHFQSLLTRLKKEAGRFIKDLGGVNVLRSGRQQENIPTTHLWWYLDEYLAGRRKAAIRRSLITLGILAAALVLLGVLYQAFLAPDPAVSAVYTHEQLARDALINGDFEAALSEAAQGLTYIADEPTLLIFKGVAEDMLGRQAEAAQTFALAERSFDSRVDFLLQRGEGYSLAGSYEKAKSDIDEALSIDPNSPSAYMYLGQVYEYSGRRLEALQAFDKAFALAEETGQTELAALARTRYVMLMQNLGVLTEVPTPTPVP